MNNKSISENLRLKLLHFTVCCQEFSDSLFEIIVDIQIVCISNIYSDVTGGLKGSAVYYM